MFVIQLARLAGFKVVASCSPKSFDLVKSYGADLVVSYHDPEAALARIKEATAGGAGVKLGADCVGGKPNVRFAVDAFGPEGGLLSSIIPGGKSHRADVNIDQVLLYRYLGKVSLELQAARLAAWGHRADAFARRSRSCRSS